MYKKVKEMCEARGISVTTLEKELGFSNGSISKWAVSTPRVDNAVKVAEYFGCTVDELITERG